MTGLVSHCVCNIYHTTLYSFNLSVLEVRYSQGDLARLSWRCRELFPSRSPGVNSWIATSRFQSAFLCSWPPFHLHWQKWGVLFLTPPCLWVPLLPPLSLLIGTTVITLGPPRQSTITSLFYGQYISNLNSIFYLNPSLDVRGDSHRVLEIRVWISLQSYHTAYTDTLLFPEI